MNGAFDGLIHSIKHCESYGSYHPSVVTVGSGDLKSFKPDGSPTLINHWEVPCKIQNIVASENVVFSTGSGFPNSNPGIDVYRYDKKDLLPYNRDHYSIYYNFHEHPNFEKWIYTAGISATATNLEIMRGWILIIKDPIDSKNHHLTYEAALIVYESITR